VLIWLAIFDEEMFLRLRVHPLHPASPSLPRALVKMFNSLKYMTQGVPKLEYEIVEHRSMSERASALLSCI
jgi:hypothetical protein